AQGQKGVYALLKPAFKWRVRPIYYYIVLIVSAYFYLAAIGASALVGEKVPTFQSLYANISFLNLSAIVLLPLFSIIYLFCEELGWRGYALKKLLTQRSVFLSAILIGI